MSSRSISSPAVLPSRRRALSSLLPLILPVVIAAAAVGCRKSAPTSAESKAAGASRATLLNVSYDPTRELYEGYNALFAKHWKAKAGQDVEIKQSHGGAAKQARAVMDGLEADVITLALAYDIDVIAQQAKLLPDDWQSKLPHNSTPYTSTIVFVVRKGNPRKINDWGDLVREDIKVITPNPKTSGGARWNYLAAWAWARKAAGGDDEKAKAFITKLYKNVPVLDSGARGATMTFVQRNIGDVLLSWENEAFMIQTEFGKDAFEVVTPSLSILAEPPVAVVESVAKKRGTTDVARAYLEYLYSPEAQAVIAERHYRPRDPEVAKRYEDRFPKLELVTVDEAFGGWTKAQTTHFSDGGIYDQIFAAGRR